MKIEDHINRIGTGLPHKCYRWKFLATHTLPKTLWLLAISLAMNIYFMVDLLEGLK